ncbi:anti-sigma factor [Echinicola pacifica]|uniref:Anti-sigma factor n=1 Tax=Echinicola pacifica TaxID=346377 RepID=A0A918PU60_9BACT|nr:FecR family protein [Echinicola pacifica]GGZ20649.1 anti-sigma factor [Echinicola pacifica]
MQVDKTIEKLIAKSLRGKISTEEQNQLNDWYRESAQEVEEISDYKLRKKEEVKNAIFWEVEKKITPHAQLFPRTRNQSIPFQWAVAAGLLVIISMSWLFRFQLGHSAESTDRTGQYEVFSNPAGTKRKIKLPDGSSIHLNHNSEVQVAADYSSNRLVKLSGEAFFEVSPNKELPFRVLTESLETRVLGTSFLVNARPGSPESVAVKTGLVKVQLSNEIGETLEPLQQVRLEAGELNRTELIDAESVFGWTEGKLVFRNSTLPQVLKALEDWYGVTIKSNVDKYPNCRLTATYHNLNLEDLLLAVNYSIPISYTINQKNIILRIQGC